MNFTAFEDVAPNAPPVMKDTSKNEGDVTMSATRTVFTLASFLTLGLVSCSRSPAVPENSTAARSVQSPAGPDNSTTVRSDQKQSSKPSSAKEPAAKKVAASNPKSEWQYQDLQDYLVANGLKCYHVPSDTTKGSMWFILGERPERVTAQVAQSRARDGTGPDYDFTVQEGWQAGLLVTRKPSEKAAHDEAQRITDRELRSALAIGPFVLRGPQKTLDMLPK
jgi:hypothetical protein